MRNLSEFGQSSIRNSKSAIPNVFASPEFTFPSFELQPQASVRVYTNEEHPESGGFSFQRKSSIWNNSSPDEAALIDPNGQTVSFISYPPGC